MTSNPHNTHSRFVAVVFASLFFALPTLALRSERLIDRWQPTHYNVAITLNSQLSEIVIARADIDIVAVKPLSVIDLDFGDMVTDEVNVDKKPGTFTHRNGKLEVSLPKTVGPGTKLHITVVYHGKPKDGLILTADKDGRPAAVGDNWPDRLHHWIPSLDHPSAKATVTFSISAPANDTVVANGRLIKVERNDIGGKTWTYSEGVPIPPYCMIIGVGEFARIEFEQSTVPPLLFYVPNSDREYAPKGFSSADEALAMFSETVGPYPYEQLALIIGATRFGGMENSSAIVFTSNLFKPNPDAKMSRAFDISQWIQNLVAHEIAHQWFGDSVTESTWADLWLSEGFATYFAGLFVEKYEGEEAFQLYMRGASETALAHEKKNRIPIHDVDTEDLSKLLNGNNYEKGAWVLHMLRSRLGNEAFFRGIRNYYQTHKNSIASTEDLRKALERSSGHRLETFFRRWVYESGHPHYEVRWQWFRKQQRVKVSLTQKQQGKLFFDPVPVVFSTSTGQITALITPTTRTSILMVPSKEKPTQIEVDPKNTLLKEVNQ